jgi:hypothetical protein
MIVIADTTPLNYLILIGETAVLAQLYERVIIPTAVRDELTNPLAPAVVRSWIASAPSWLETQAAVTMATDFPPGLGPESERPSFSHKLFKRTNSLPMTCLLAAKPNDGA